MAINQVHNVPHQANSTLSNPALELPSNPKFSFSAMRLTPEIAQHWLEKHNTANRAISKPTVKKYAAQMEEGRWLDYNVVVKFAPGRMVNGQHTCSAVILSNTAIRILVVTGLSDDIFTVEDTGRRRSAADVLVIEGVLPWQAQTAAAGAHFLLCHLDGLSLWSTVKYQNQDVRDFYLERPLYAEVVDFLSTLRRVKPPLTYGPAACLAYLFARKDYAMMVQFFTALQNGVGMGETDPVYHLRSWLDDSIKVGRDRPSMREQMIATIRAWNLHRNGKTIKTRGPIRVRMTDTMPEIL